MSDVKSIHYQPIHRSPVRGRTRTLALSLCALLVVSFLFACGRDEEEPTATIAPVVEPAAIATEAPTQQPESPLAEPATVAVDGPVAPQPEPTTAITASVDSNGTTAVFTPLEVDEGIQCDIESHIDLTGYPDLEQTLGCPTGEASTDSVAINEFGEGPEFDRFMLWFNTPVEPDEQIYVLFPDGTWEGFEDTWVEGDPTFACNPLGGEADSPPLPRRGFGKLWCSDPTLQEVLGAVPREERLCQHSVVQPFGDGRLLACFEDATIRYFHLFDDNTWAVVVQ